MRIEKAIFSGEFDFAIMGLGYESRAVNVLENFERVPTTIYALGYSNNTNVLFYEGNEKKYLERDATLIKGSDQEVLVGFEKCLKEKVDGAPLNILLDITVMTRHRMGCVIVELLENLPKNSTVTVLYSLSTYVSPPTESTPIKIVDELCSGMSGEMGDLSLPVSLLIGLGYEPDKALGVCGLLDAEETFVFVPHGIDKKFEEDVKSNNEELLVNLPASNQFSYDVIDPYNTYISLKALLLDLVHFSRPLIVPLGPKIITALSVILAFEFDKKIPVWRVSSEHTERPTERPASDELIKFTFSI